MEFCIEDVEEILGDIQYIEDESTNFAKLILEDTSLSMPIKNSDELKEERSPELYNRNFPDTQGFSIGTNSTIASSVSPSDSILLPFIGNTDRTNSEDKEEKYIEERKEDENKIE